MGKPGPTAIPITTRLHTGKKQPTSIESTMKPIAEGMKGRNDKI